MTKNKFLPPDISGSELSRILSNTMKFVNPKSIYLPNVLMISCNPDTIRAYACDDYFAISDSAERVTIDPLFKKVQFTLTLEDVKELEEWARKENKKNNIDIDIKPSSVTFSNGVEKKTFIKSDLILNWEIVEDLIFSNDYTEHEMSDFVLRPERLSRISQLKADKEAPFYAKFIIFEGGNIPLLRFKLGSTIHGGIRPVDKEKVKSEFL